jgi:hypothetical protein
MAGYRLDTFQYALLIHIRPIVRCCAVTKKTWVTSFSISCANCLWDVVGHFLGCRLQPLEAGSIGACGHLPLDGAGEPSSYFK